MIQGSANGKAVVISAPSGAGKTTIVHALLGRGLPLAFSVSACSRPPRANERNGVDYHFLGVEGFRSAIENKLFIEYEEVYAGQYYGTLASEVQAIWRRGLAVIFDVDVVGGINLKTKFGNMALSIFIEPPSVAALEQRLRRRQTESDDKIAARLQKAQWELGQKTHFDCIVVNEHLDDAIDQAFDKVNAFLNL